MRFFLANNTLLSNYFPSCEMVRGKNIAILLFWPFWLPCKLLSCRRKYEEKTIILEARTSLFVVKIKEILKTNPSKPMFTESKHILLNIRVRLI